MSIEDLREEYDDYQEDAEQVETETVDDEQDIDDSDEQDDADSQGDEQSEGDADSDLDFSFDEDAEQGDPFAGQKAPEWVKKIREENRELKRQQREWQQQQGQAQQQALPERPLLEDYDYDDESYYQALETWMQTKAQHDAQVQAETAKYQKYDDTYKQAVDEIKTRVPNYDEIEQSIVDVLPVQRQAMIKMMTDNPARMVVALNNSPAKLQALAELDDMQFAKQIVLMEANMANVKRNPNKPKPTSHKLEGAAGGGDRQLEKLEAEADKTGDRSKIHAYKRKMRNK